MAIWETGLKMCKPGIVDICWHVAYIGYPSYNRILIMKKSINIPTGHFQKYLHVINGGRYRNTYELDSFRL